MRTLHCSGVLSKPIAPSLRDTSRYTKLFRKFPSSADWMSCSPQMFSRVLVSTSDHKKPRVVLACMSEPRAGSPRVASCARSGAGTLTLRIMTDVWIPAASEPRGAALPNNVDRDSCSSGSPRTTRREKSCRFQLGEHYSDAYRRTPGASYDLSVCVDVFTSLAKRGAQRRDEPTDDRLRSGLHDPNSHWGNPKTDL